jgi:Tfp pilus assembly protein PilF
MMRYADAEAACRTAIARDPTYFSAHSNLAKVLALQGRLDDALRSSETAVRTATELGKARNPWATSTWRTFGTMERISQRSTARQSFERALECDPSDAWTHLLLARLFLEVPNRESAAVALEKARMVEELVPYPDPRIEQVLAHANFRMGFLDEAADRAQECLRMDREAIACHFILAAARAQLPGQGGAAQHYDAAMALWNRQGHATVSVSASREVLWYETDGGLRELCQEAASSLGVSCAQ